MLITYPTVSKNLLLFCFKQVFDNQSLERALMNYYLQSISISGNVIDLGAGSENPSYLKFFKKRGLKKLIMADLYPQNKKILKLDLEKAFKLSQNQFDYAICLNVLEHIYNFQNVIKETKKILKPKGKFIVSTPFVYHLHGSPNDFFRYSHQAIEKMFKQQDFKFQKIIYLGFGPFTASISLVMFIFPKIIRAILIIFCIYIDQLIVYFSDFWRHKHPLGYLYIFSPK